MEERECEMQQREAERRKAEEVARAKQREEIRKRNREQEASLAKVEQKTKRYFIKKNKGLGSHSLIRLRSRLLYSMLNLLTKIWNLYVREVTITMIKVLIEL